MAKQFAQAGEAAGADGILLLPPYLLNADPAGLIAHVEAVCAATKLGVVFYNRDNAILNDVWLEKLCARCPNLVGFKDGYGDIGVDDAYLRADGRPVDLYWRSADRRDFRPAVSGAGRDDLLVGDLQFSAGVCAELLCSGAAA